MEFLTPGEKIKRLRKMLGLKQEELAGENFARNFISMLEAGRRNLTLETATTLAREFNKIAKGRGLAVNVTAEYLMSSAEEDVHNYYLNVTKNTDEITEIEEIIKYSTEKNFSDVLMIAYEKLGNMYYDKTEYSKACACYFDALVLVHQVGDKGKLSYLYNKVGKCKIRLSDYNEAITFCNKAYGYAGESNNNEDKKNILFNLALCNKKLGNYDDAIYLISEHLTICNPDKERDAYLNAMVLKVNCYVEMKEFDTALFYYESLLDSLKENEVEFKSYIYNNMGLTYLHLEQFETSLKYFDMSLAIKKDSNKLGMAHTMIDKSKVYVKLQRINEALTDIKQAIEIVKDLNDKEYLKKAYRLLEEIYITSGDMDKLEETYIDAINLEKNSSEKTALLLLYAKLANLYVKKGNSIQCGNCLDELINSII